MKTMVAAFLVLAIAVLLLFPLDPAVKIGDFEPMPYTGKLNPSPKYIVQDHYFQSTEKDVVCHAWLYLPLDYNDTISTSATASSSSEDEFDESEIAGQANSNNTNNQLPVVIMASGFAEQKDFGLDAFAERFVQRGFAVFLFDYRSFGASQGVPRNLVSPKRHVEDWHAAIDYIVQTKQLHDTINPQKIGLWGMSFAGGHVLTVASQRQEQCNNIDTSIVSVVAQAPFLKSASSTKKMSKKRGQWGKMRLVVAALQDALRGHLGLAPVVIPILGAQKGQLAMMPTTPESLRFYQSLHPPQKLGGWINRGPVRGLLELKGYSPLETVRRKPPQIPVLLVSGSRDAVCPANVIQEVDGILPQSRVITRNASHVELMGPDHAPEVAEEMAEFFAETFQSLAEEYS